MTKKPIKATSIDMMRSLFRLSELIKLESPMVLIDTERSIINKRIKKLSADDLLRIVSEFPEYLKEQVKQSEVDAIITQKEFDIYLKSMN